MFLFLITCSAVLSKSGCGDVLCRIVSPLCRNVSGKRPSACRPRCCDPKAFSQQSLPRVTKWWASLHRNLPFLHLHDNSFNNAREPPPPPPPPAPPAPPARFDSLSSALQPMTSLNLLADVLRMEANAVYPASCTKPCPVCLTACPGWLVITDWFILVKLESCQSATDFRCGEAGFVSQHVQEFFSEKSLLCSSVTAPVKMWYLHLRLFIPSSPWFTGTLDIYSYCRLLICKPASPPPSLSTDKSNRSKSGEWRAFLIRWLMFNNSFLVSVFFFKKETLLKAVWL